MQRINLLYVITKLELGGAQKQVLSLIKHLDRERFNLFLFTSRDGLLIPEARAIEGLTLRRSRCLGRAINPLRDLFALVEIYRFIKEHNIAIVHTHSSKAGILGRVAARLAKVRVIVHTVHGWSFNNRQSLFRRLFFTQLERFTARFTDKLIAVSAYDIQKGLNKRIGTEKQYELIRYGIDYAEFDNTGYRNIREELGIAPNELVVGMVACFKPQKSPQDFVKLAYLITDVMPEARFVLVGDGVLRKNIEKLIRRLGLQGKVILTGWRRDIPEVLAVIDIFALTSLWEGLPVAVLEAMVSYKPVVATHTGGVCEVVAEGESGFLVAPRDIEAMSERLLLLLKDRPLRLRMGQRARHLLDPAFTLARMIGDSRGLYEQLVVSKGVCHAA